MGIRLSLAVRILLMALPLFLGAQWLRRELARSADVDSVVRTAMDAMENGGKERCESAPERFGGPLPFGERRPPRDARRGPPIFVWAYDKSFASGNVHAPPFPTDLQQALQGGSEQPSRFREDGTGPPLQVGLRTGWSDGPCAFLLIERRDPIGAPPAGPLGPGPGTERFDEAGHEGPREGPAREGARRDPPRRPRPEQQRPSFWWQAGVLALAVVFAATFAAWPLVRRIRKLTAEVRKSAAAGYLSDVPAGGKDELAALAREFNAAGRSVRATIDSLHEQEQALRAFLSNTTHDVMHPLSVLQGHLSALRKAHDAGKPLDPSVLHGCQEEAHFVASLVHNLTAAARLQAGVVPFDKRPLDLRRVVERAAARHRPMANARGMSLEVGVPSEEVSVEGDVTLLEQAVSNLVHNAVRYNTTGRHVAVSLDREDGTFVLTVLDDGPGVSAEELPKLCDRRFRTATAWRTSPDGAGIGLAIVREVTERHGFVLQLDSPAGGGFTSRIRGAVVTSSSDSRKESGTSSGESRTEAP